MRAKKGTRIATATELLLVEPLVSGSVSVTFSLTLKPGRKNIIFTQRIYKIDNRQVTECTGINKNKKKEIKWNSRKTRIICW